MAKLNSFADFGWSLADVFNPQHSRLQQFRSNLLNTNQPSKAAKGRDAASVEVGHWNSNLRLFQQKTGVSPLRRIRQDSQGFSSDSCIGSDTSSVTSEGNSEDSDCSPMLQRHRWMSRQLSSSIESDAKSLKRAMDVVQARGLEISSVFQEVREIHDDLTEMNNLVSQMTDSVDRVKHLRSSPRLSNPQSCESSANRCTPQPSSKRKFRDMDEDEMVEVTYRVLKRACHLTLARAEGNVDVSLIV